MPATRSVSAASVRGKARRRRLRRRPRPRFRRPRRRQRVALLAALIAVVVLMLVLGWGVGDYRQNIALNLGSDLIGAIVTIFVIMPLITRAQEGRVREHAKLDYEWYVDRVADATSSVRVLDTFSNMLDGPVTPRLFQAVEQALERRAVVQVLLLDPTSLAAAQRARELGDPEVRREIMRNLRVLDEFRREILAELRPSFEVRLYAASPSITLYRWDDKALVSFFPLDKLSGQGTQLEVAIDSPLGVFVSQRFNELWKMGRDLEKFTRLHVTLVEEADSTERDFQVAFVEYDAVLYVVEPQIVVQMARQRKRTVAYCHRDRSVFYELSVVDDGEPERLARLSELFQEKYGESGDIFVYLRPLAENVEGPGGETDEARGSRRRRFLP